MRLRYILPILFIGTGSSVLRAQTTASYNDVLLIVNDSSRNSVTIGDYFAQRRHIPAAHIYHFRADTSETMDSATFIPLKWALQGWMRSHNLVDSINYIVTTKGCPLRIATRQWDQFDSTGKLVALGGQSSFEDCLALINGVDSVRILSTRTQFYQSRYYNSTEHFKHNQQTMPYYLVTRLDAYTVDQVKGIILKAENPVAADDGLWVLDLDPTRDNASYGIGNTWLRDADSILRQKELHVMFDEQGAYVHDQKNVVGYASWGSNDNASGGGEAAKPRNTWLNGSIAETYVSTGGRSFQPGAGYGQSLVADWIAEGASAVKGYTDEPYLIVMAEPDILFNRYTSGFNMAESYWSASPLIAWRQVVIGDPKMMLRTNLSASSESLDFNSGPRYMTLSDSVWVRNTSGVPLVVKGASMLGADSLDFTFGPLTVPKTIQPGDSLALPLGFRPTAYRLEGARVRVAYRLAGDSADRVLFVSLTGTGVRPFLAASDTVDFDANIANSVRSIHLRNATPTDTMNITKITIGGTAAARFKVDPSVTFPHRLIGGETWDLPIVYLGGATSTELATATISSTASRTTIVRLRATPGFSGVEDRPVATGRMDLTCTPNPFGARTLLRYRVPVEGGMAELEIVDASGQMVVQRSLGAQIGGEHATVFDASGLASGSYLCRLVVTMPDGRTRTMVQSLLHEQ